VVGGSLAGRVPQVVYIGNAAHVLYRHCIRVEVRVCVCVMMSGGSGRKKPLASRDIYRPCVRYVT